MDRPIIFSGPMVRALLEGSKTMTRLMAWSGHKMPHECEECGPQKPTVWQRVQPGNLLWVRETYGVSHRGDATPQGKPYDPAILYRSSDKAPSGYDAKMQWEPFRWRSSIHMPRWASRLTLKVTATKIEQLQDINCADAVAEGCMIVSGKTLEMSGYHFDGCIDLAPSPVSAFEEYWGTLHGPDAWDENPEVVALTFKVHHCNIDKAAK